MIGPGKGFDTDRYFVICSNVIGGLQGQQRAEQHRPGHGQGVRARLSRWSRSATWCGRRSCWSTTWASRSCSSVAGGSMGGMQALQWAVAYPEVVASCISDRRHSASTRPCRSPSTRWAAQAIMADPNWNGGDYYQGESPDSGLAVARMIGHITYLSDESMHEKFGRRLRDKKAPDYDFSLDFEVESYLRYQGEVFTRRFDANTYLYITKALDYFDLSAGSGVLVEAFRELPEDMRFLVIAFSSDWLYPPYQSKEIVQRSEGQRARLLLPGDALVLRPRRLPS